MAALAVATVLPVPAARADLVGQFDAAIRNIRSWGGYTVVASTRVYETSGAPAPQLASAVVHFPRGASVRRSFLTRRFFCDPATLQKNPDPALCRARPPSHNRYIRYSVAPIARSQSSRPGRG